MLEAHQSKELQPHLPTQGTPLSLATFLDCVDIARFFRWSSKEIEDFPLMGELVAALRANDHDLFKRWPYGGIEDLGEPVVTELLLDGLLDPFLTVEEQDRLLDWHLGGEPLDIRGEDRMKFGRHHYINFDILLLCCHSVFTGSILNTSQPS